MKTTNLFQINFIADNKNCTGWIKAKNIDAAIKKAQDVLLGFTPNLIGYEFTVKLINDQYIN